MGAPQPYVFLGGVPIKVHFTIHFFLVNYRNSRRFLYNYFLFLSVIRVGQSFSWHMWKQVVSMTGYCGCRLKPYPFGYCCNIFCGIILLVVIEYRLSLKNSLLVKKVSLVYDLFISILGYEKLCPKGHLLFGFTFIYCFLLRLFLFTCLRTVVCIACVLLLEFRQFDVFKQVLSIVCYLFVFKISVLIFELWWYGKGGVRTRVIAVEGYRLDHQAMLP